MKRQLVTAVLSAALLASWTQPATAQPGEDFSSTIYSASTKSCVDVPGGTTDVNTDVRGRTCDGAAEEKFRFQQVPGRSADTYDVVNAASGLCLAQFRFGVRQRNCLIPVPYDPVLDMWTLVPLDAAATEFQFTRTSDAGAGLGRCLAAHATPSPVLRLDFCNKTDPAQSFTRTG
ncbi:MAG: hypothetical protein JWQ81_4793 [Amycolatopsis sp.]|jgi:hypothetical protein|uniref:RICIN domain-containing protein n=1 Tax=Amycolatopsis sp. TaxID=37632 RepID=UPI002607C5BB|nr:RICIN domain-containing protein [Amycolatopsis sp.]MCU1684054.1 hypothetical protein [Amycolatopsis sp.]